MGFEVVWSECQKKWPTFQPQFWAPIAMSKFLVAWKQN